ncbi:hypothetical protein [Candidatus Viadribacter manganicus]|uniref:DUF4345 domain-containing protein n=1 Tax=Candidatus Viadribacter manganicus TaxID=1759059 RepID=A0A1B1AIJ3_9PROT|nr:hypothetical protein [Candidatus Viadribacter manganicus]ANP46382.1 hypothetical protein ATE48_10875 [Candidatus Viadribacter manganicus]
MNKLEPIKRVAAGLLGLGGAANGVFMLAAPALWYDSVPGLAHTGPFNAHFVSDIGVAYLVANLALLARACRPRYWPAAIAGAAFMCGHAMIHVLDIAMQRTGNASVDAWLVIVPALLAAWAATPTKEA